MCFSFSGEDAGDVEGGGGDADGAAPGNEVFSEGVFEEVEGFVLGVEAKFQGAAEAADVFLGGWWFEFELEFSGEEAVAASDVFDGDGGDVADFVEAAGDLAFAAGGVE